VSLPLVDELDAAGVDWLRICTPKESAARLATKVWVIETVAVSPAATVAVVADAVRVSEDATTALVGPEAKSPSPNAVTTTSASRLKVNFVMYFLSIVVFETFSNTAGKEELSAL